jgi:hypothetical protein
MTKGGVTLVIVGVVVFVSYFSVFTIPQTIMITCGAVLITAALLDVTRKKLTPYWVNVKPNWWEFLPDIIEEQWGRVKGPGNLQFTVLQKDLFFRDDTHIFLSELSFRWSYEWPDDLKKHAPQFSLKQVTEEEGGVFWQFSVVKWTGDWNDPQVVPLARLPQDFYGVFYDGGLSRRRREKLEEQIRKDGWEMADRNHGIPGYNPPIELRHKNLTVQFKPI